MFMELYKFSRLVMHLNSCSMDLGCDTLTQVIPGINFVKIKSLSIFILNF